MVVRPSPTATAVAALRRVAARAASDVWAVGSYFTGSQLAVDSLSGNGRMLSEGEALLEHMADHIAEWRAPKLSNLHRRRG